MADVDAAYVTYFPDLDIPGADEVVGSFIETALANNVKRLVLLSGRGEEGARRAEVRLQDPDAEWTVVRCGFFSQYFSETFPDPIRHGILPLPTGDNVDPFLDADDIADVVVASLLDDRHIGQLYELTGPRLLAISEVAETLSVAIGREVRFVSMSKKDYAADISQQGFPGEVGGSHRRCDRPRTRWPQRHRHWRCPEGVGSASTRFRRLRPRRRGRGSVEPPRQLIDHLTLYHFSRKRGPHGHQDRTARSQHRRHRTHVRSVVRVDRFGHPRHTPNP